LRILDELEKELEWELGLEPPKHPELPLVSPNPDFCPKLRFSSVSKLKLTAFEGVFGRLSKPENIASAPGEQATQSQLPLRVSRRKCMRKEPWAVNSRGCPPKGSWDASWA